MCIRDSLTVRGGATLRGGEFTFEEDFHEITTFLALGAITGGDVVVRNSTPSNFPLIDRTFAKFGVDVYKRQDKAVGHRVSVDGQQCE